MRKPLLSAIHRKIEHGEDKPVSKMLHHENENLPDYEKLAKRLEQDMDLSKELTKRIVQSIQEAEQRRGYCDSDCLADIHVLHPRKRDQNSLARCTNTVIVKAGEKRCLRKGLFNVNAAYSGILSYYACCTNIVNLGILISEIWRPADLERYIGALVIAQKQGINTLLILRERDQLYPLRII